MYDLVMATTTQIHTPDRDRRLAALRASDNESARLCANDAAACLWSAGNEADLTKPGHTPDAWVEAADRWIARGAQHLFGWVRNNPEGW